MKGEPFAPRAAPGPRTSGAVAPSGHQGEPPRRCRALGSERGRQEDGPPQFRASCTEASAGAQVYPREERTPYYGCLDLHPRPGAFLKTGSGAED